MSFLVREYNVPFLGKVKLIESSGYDKSFNGNYYAENKELGEFVNNCNTFEELNKRVLVEIKNYFNNEIINSELKIESEKEKLGKLEGHFGDLEEKIKNGSLEWSDSYQTENPLQLDYQEIKRLELINRN
jgi:hypothetical protein